MEIQEINYFLSPKKQEQMMIPHCFDQVKEKVFIFIIIIKNLGLISMHINKKIMLDPISNNLYNSYKLLIICIYYFFMNQKERNSDMINNKKNKNLFQFLPLKLLLFGRDSIILNKPQLT